MKNIALFLWLISFGAPLGLAEPFSAKNYPFRPKLIVVLSIDQFRADYLTRFKDKFLPEKTTKGGLGGFKTLLHQGAYFPNAEYSILQCMTGPGHAVILSGSLPYRNGIGLNSWFENGAPKYCVQDDSSSIVSMNADESKSLRGISPRTFIGSTLGDEMKNAGLKSKVVSISLKDRAAVLLGGVRADAAFWFEPKINQWVSSSYYLKDKKLPDWVKTLNQEILKNKAKPYSWGSQSLTLGSKEALATPYGVELTVDFAEKAIERFELGKGGTDLLALSLSSHDYLGHQYGTETPEMLEMTLAEDKLLARLLNSINRHVPLSQVWVVLTADHGIVHSPTALKEHKFSAGHIDTEALRELAEGALSREFGPPKEKTRWIPYVNDLQFWINLEEVKRKDLLLSSAEETAKKALLGGPGIPKPLGVESVLTHSEFVNGRVTKPDLRARMERSYFEGRSGQLIVIPEPFFIEKGDTISHMTGFSYDRTVPLLMMGAPFKPGVYPTRIDPIDLAPTLSFLLGIIAPAQSEGRILGEAIGTKPSNHP